MEVVELRIYKRYDQDLMALKQRGANIPTLVRSCLYAFARGKRVYYKVPDDVLIDANDRYNFHLRIEVEDPESIRLLKSVKEMHRNAFCKAILREAFVFQNLGVYLTDESYCKMRNDSANDIPAEVITLKESGQKALSAPKKDVSEYKETKNENVKSPAAPIGGNLSDFDFEKAFNNLM